MSDQEDNVPAPAAAAPQEEVKEEPLNINSALALVIKKAKLHDQVLHGLNEVVKSIDRKKALLIVLADDCQEAKYKKLVETFAKQNEIPVLTSKRQIMAEMVGYHKVDTEGKPRKMKNVSSIAILDWVEDNKATRFVLDHIGAK